MFGVLRPSSPERELPQIPSHASVPLPRSLAPMPPGEFSSREELLAACKDWAAQQGYAVVIARSRFNRLWLKCDRGGNYENRRNLTPEARKRKRGDSRLLGCKFRMIASVKKDGKWRVETETSEHNHGPSTDLSAHPTLRRMTDDQVAKVNEMCDEGRSPADTLDALRCMWPGIKVLTRDIYNARKKYKTQKEIADGQPEPQPFQDPNEMGLPGPSRNGRWAWVPDGDEVISKKSKKRKNPGTQLENGSLLDPRLQESQNHSPTHQPSFPAVSSFTDEFRNDHSQPDLHTRSPPPPLFERFDARSNTTHHAVPLNAITTFLQAENTNNGIRSSLPDFPNESTPTHQTNPSHLRSQSPPSPATLIATPNPTPSIPQISPSDADPQIANTRADPATTTTLSTKATGQNGQVLMSRIERMEQEQRDQKNMLAQILGAVKGMSNAGSNGSGASESP